MKNQIRTNEQVSLVRRVPKIRQNTSIALKELLLTIQQSSLPATVEQATP